MDQLTNVSGGPLPGGYVYDLNGNVTSTPNTTLTWSGGNRVKTMTKSGSPMVSYGLDVSGRTLTRSQGGVTSTYKYAGDGDTADWVVDGSVTTRYVGGAGGLSAAQVVGGATTWMLPAPHGDVWAHTDGSGTVTATFSYDEYGVAQSPATGTQGLDRYGWLGKQQRETDTSTGLILMGVRVYDPALGRFLSVDPIHGGSANNYEYVAANPVNLFDLDGRAVCWQLWKSSCRARAGSWARTRNWGMFAAGVTNLTWGSYKLTRGVGTIVGGIATGNGWAVGKGLRDAGGGAYRLGKGIGQTVAGVHQTCRSCSIRSHARTYVRQMTPRSAWDWLSLAP